MYGRIRLRRRDARERVVRNVTQMNSWTSDRRVLDGGMSGRRMVVAAAVTISVQVTSYAEVIPGYLRDLVYGFVACERLTKIYFLFTENPTDSTLHFFCPLEYLPATPRAYRAQRKMTENVPPTLAPV